MGMFDQIANQTGGILLQNFACNLIEGITGKRPNLVTQNNGLHIENSIFGINSASRNTHGHHRSDGFNHGFNTHRHHHCHNQQMFNFGGCTNTNELMFMNDLNYVPWM